MSVECSIGICYGVIISDEDLRKVNELFADNDDALDEFSEKYLRQINSWTGGDWFLGLNTDFSSDVVLLASVHWSKTDIEELEEQLHKYNIINVINWMPQKYIIQFWY